jgi:hypothetical protein
MPDDTPRQGRGLGGTLKSKWGPLPVWGWLLAVTILLLGYYLWTRRSGAQQTTAPIAGQPGVVVINQGDTDIPGSTTPPAPSEDHDKDDKKKKKKGKDEPEDKESGEQEQDERHRDHKTGAHRRHRHHNAPPVPVPVAGHGPGAGAPGGPLPAKRLGIPKPIDIGSFFPTVTPVYGPAGGQAGGRAGGGPA